jgi:hypothetical protein
MRHSPLLYMAKFLLCGIEVNGMKDNGIKGTHGLEIMSIVGDKATARAATLFKGFLTKSKFKVVVVPE